MDEAVTISVGREFQIGTTRWANKLPHIQPNYGHRYTQWVTSGDAGGIESKKRCFVKVVIGPNVKLECVTRFCYLGDILGAGGGVEEAARARVRCAWAKFKELSPILTALGASYRIKGKIYRACVQSVLTYGTETWAMKDANLQSLERTERMIVRWMCGVSLKDRKWSVDLYSLLRVESRYNSRAIGKIIICF